MGPVLPDLQRPFLGEHKLLAEKTRKKLEEAAQSGSVDGVNDPPSPVKRHDSFEEQASQGSFVPHGHQDVLTAVIGRPEHPGCVTWDAIVFGVFNPNFPLYIKHEDLSEIFEAKRYIKSWMQSSKRDVYLGAYLNGGHWQMVVILPKEYLVVWFCSLHNRPYNYLKGIINSALKGLDDAPQSKSKVAARWIVVKCNRQKGSTECGYYVMHWMSTIILGSFRNNWKAYFNDPRPLEPERLKALQIQWG
ncbi:hypothetical protein HKD37_03G006752 [Glycine soja]